MTIKDLLREEISVDVVDDYSDDLWIAFEGPVGLTPRGAKRYAEVLDLPVQLRPVWGYPGACVLLNDREDCERLERKCRDLFGSLAGWCSDLDYRTWFKEVEQ